MACAAGPGSVGPLPSRAPRRARSSRCSPTGSAPACCWPPWSAWWRRASLHGPSSCPRRGRPSATRTRSATFILARGDEELIRNLETANTIELGDAFFRTCVARDDRRRYFCTFIDAEQGPAGHRRGSERRAELQSTGAEAAARARPTAAPRTRRCGCGRRAATSPGPSARSTRAPSTRGRSCGPTARIRPFTATATSRCSPNGTPRQRPGHARGEELRRPASRRGTAPHWRPPRGSRPVRDAKRRHAPAEQLGPRPDPVGHRPRVAVQDLALDPGAEQARPAPPPSRAAALHLGQADAHHLGEVARVDRELPARARGVRERGVPVLPLEHRATSRSATVATMSTLRTRLSSTRPLRLSRRLHEERHGRDLLDVALARGGAGCARPPGTSSRGRRSRRRGRDASSPVRRRRCSSSPIRWSV